MGPRPTYGFGALQCVEESLWSKNFYCNAQYFSLEYFVCCLNGNDCVILSFFIVKKSVHQTVML